ncbi:MAG: zf-HC2 domain-containing protein, partial [Thiohalomonadales bacterium]
MNCTQSQNMLDGYIDDLLSVIQLNDVQAHLNDCNKCRGVFTQAQDLANTLKDMPIPPAKIGYEQRMLKFLEKKKSQNKRHTSWFIAGFGSAITASFALWL